MRTLTIARREILSFFVSPVAYFVITGFVLIAGFFFVQGLQAFAEDQQMAAAQQFSQESLNLNQHVIEIFYRVMVLMLVFLTPILTMRLIAEEKKSGTFELLATSPVSVWNIVWGKFLGVSFILLIMTGLIFAFPLFLYFLGNPELPPIITGFVALFLSGLAFAAIGMACSSFTENQVVGAITGTVVLLLLYVLQGPTNNADSLWAQVLQVISPTVQADSLFRGVIELKSLVYFASVIFLGVSVSKTALDAQRWR